MEKSEKLRKDLDGLVSADISPMHLVIKEGRIIVRKADEEEMTLSPEEAETLVYLLRSELKRRTH